MGPSLWILLLLPYSYLVMKVSGTLLLNLSSAYVLTQNRVLLVWVFISCTKGLIPSVKLCCCSSVFQTRILCNHICTFWWFHYSLCSKTRVLWVFAIGGNFYILLVGKVTFNISFIWRDFLSFHGSIMQSLPVINYLLLINLWSISV